MSAKIINRERKYEAIKREYSSLVAVKELGKRKYTTALIVAKLAQKYYLSEGRISQIIWS
jgi:DNA repair protein RadC